MNVNERISSLRKLMAERGIDAYIVPTYDPHQSEYVGEHWKTRVWMSGFTGSAGTFVVTKDVAALWTDGRYFIQAGNQLKGSEVKLFKMGIPGVPSYMEWLKTNKCAKYYDGIEELLSTLKKIDDQFQLNPPVRVCSHNDVLSENFIYDQENDNLQLIDWEYCGMNYYMFDVAAIIVENRLNAEKEEEFLTSYYGHKPTEREKADVLIGKFLMDALWCPWALVQLVSKPDEEEFYWNYGLERITRCQGYMAHPKFNEYVELMGKK
jgi:hypothetical protein